VLDNSITQLLSQNSEGSLQSYNSGSEDNVNYVNKKPKTIGQEVLDKGISVPALMTDIKCGLAE
jgi:hypothetical protein